MGVKITIIDGQPASREQLQAAFIREDFKDLDLVENEKGVQGICLWIGDKQQTPPKGISEADCFVRPVRLGAVLDRVRRHAGAGITEKSFPVGSYILDVLTGELSGHGKIIRLTDKEKQILILLHDANGKTVERETLLKKVWSYAEGLETHTLETHIYRLRQKIERDPAKPDILLTDGSGYKIA